MTRPRVLLLGGVGLLFIVVFAARGGLRGEAVRDEPHFLRWSIELTDPFPPDLERLTSYNELSTPLPFLLFGVLEMLTGDGLWWGRLLNFLMGAGAVMLVALSGRRVRVTALCVAGMVACPYLIGTAVYMYTDMIAASLGLAGVMLHLRRRFVGAAVLAALAIACRQYMVAFPIALLGWEIAHRPWRGAAIASSVAASATMGGWLLLFGGPAPERALRARDMYPAEFSLHPDHAVYFLSCVGLYYVLPELVLLHGRRWLRDAVHWSTALLALGVAIVAILWPPLGNEPPYTIETMGLLDRAARIVLPDGLRVTLFAALALLAVLRFQRPGLAQWLVFVNAIMLAQAHIAWDKYALPCLMCLWLVRASEQGRD